ncbi:MAG: choice-of-anchor D domain-containing protein [Alphaproteobacteria bacterium]|nr:choice-of-anchor D domain-containing protein [Alphaproteobacteria bacterium]
MTLALLVALVGCKQDTDFQQLYPRIATAPEELAFGEIAVPLDGHQQLFVTNAGRARLEMQVAIQGDDAFTVDVPAEVVGVDETIELDVTFAPGSFLDYAAEIVITSNDDLTPEVRIPLSGTGVDAPMPDIEIDRLTVDFGTVAMGSNSTEFLLLRNVGDAPLELGTVGQEGSGAFVLQTDPSNDVVGPHSDVPVIIQYAPFGDLGDSGELVFPSSDPDEPEVRVVLLGNGGGDYAYPVAQIDCPGTSAPPIWVDLDGSGSYDPEGFLPLTYAWTLSSRPDGSQEDLTNLVSDTTRLFTDVAGPYEVQLVVTNAVGTVSAPDRCTIDAIPADELHVELTWDTPAADLDLHLARNGADIFTPTDDCSFCNGSPNWGVAGSDDDPRLDLDDQGGFGPENINILTPADGDYVVRVHYWEEHGDDVVVATVRVFTYGVEVYTGQRAMQRNEVWDVGQVNWPDGTFGSYSVNNYDSPDRTCTP